MKQSFLRRLERVEARQGLWQRPPETFSRLETALRIGFALRVGGNAREELDAADASMGPERREELNEQVAAARRIAATLAKYSPAKQVEPGEPAWR